MERETHLSEYLQSHIKLPRPRCAGINQMDHWITKAMLPTGCRLTEDKVFMMQHGETNSEDLFINGTDLTGVLIYRSGRRSEFMRMCGADFRLLYIDKEIG